MAGQNELLRSLSYRDQIRVSPIRWVLDESVRGQLGPQPRGEGSYFLCFKRFKSRIISLPKPPELMLPQPSNDEICL
jgi:hypothetical protein